MVTGGVLAHTFYPAAPNPEPIAGDMHLDNDENWNAGREHGPLQREPCMNWATRWDWAIPTTRPM